MERLTNHDPKGAIISKDTGPNWLSDIINRLAVYEDACFDEDGEEVVTPEIIQVTKEDLVTSGDMY